jgi:nucleoside-diphosphate-sugar epimerase
MRIAIAGARGEVGQAVVALAQKKGHFTIEINRSKEDKPDTEHTEHRTADLSKSYEDTRKAFEGCDALIHLSSVPNPVGTQI